ncbi:Alpha/Beta hydrolase protein [Coniella lustricola]|uniref:Carboxylic ester hydrolase n=1 Tax=Coniella lustricola TaxID=2025994 RepID=A0A2T3A253_9PEZI|nr:Alpha/Beta hydrolase protein [Coniella lustricola]
MIYSSARFLVTSALVAAVAKAQSSFPSVVDTELDVTYEGLYRNNIEVFLGVRYGQDTSGQNRFKPPQSYVPPTNSTIAAQQYGPACPQWYGEGSWYPPYTLSNYTAISEDCLTLNVARPNGVAADANLPVMVYVYGGSLITGEASDATILPDGLILQSIENETPIIHVAMNYRLGFFGFAHTPELAAEGSLNVGYKDQRLAMEWVRDNIKAFGGDPERITVYGQSSGASSIGIHLVSYGGARPVPFQQAILESGTFDVGILANYTPVLTQEIIEDLNCTSALTNDTLACLRSLDSATVGNASLARYWIEQGINSGTLWLAAVDGDFLPDSPIDLVNTGRFASNVTVMMGWMDNDLASLTNVSITTESEVHTALRNWDPDLTEADVEAMLAHYPLDAFSANAAAGLSQQFYRLTQIYRDIVMACQPIWFGGALADKNGADSVYLFEWNQTILDPIFTYLYGQTGLGVGVFHESEFAYVFGNLSHYDIDGWPFDPTAADYALAQRAPRSYAEFVTSGKPTGGNDTFVGWTPAFANGNGNATGIFVVGGPSEGLSSLGGAEAAPAVAVQDLADRCAFLTQEEWLVKFNI